MQSPLEEWSAWKAWEGRTQEQRDLVTPMPLAGLAALMDTDADIATGFAAPLLSHWLFFSPLVRQSELGEDGHPARGDFLPPVTLPRRMWAGSRLRFHRPICVDEEIHRVSRIQSVDVKNGRSGPLAFVTVRHEIHGPEGHAITEEQDVVYRDAASPGAPAAAPLAAPTDETFSRTVAPDPVLLFRYSALTFNGHRIHYDRPYATGVEHYPGLVVHGPLTATLLLDLLRKQRPVARVRRYEFRAMSPLFDDAPFTLCGRWDDEGEATLWARSPSGALAMRATAEID